MLDAGGPHPPRVAYLGEPLPPSVDLATLVRSTSLGRRESQPDDDPGLTILPQADWGHAGEPAVVVEHPGGALCWRFKGIEILGDGYAFEFLDDVARMTLRLSWRVLASGLLSARAALANNGTAPVRLHWLAALTLPLPSWAQEATQVHGRWSGEFHLAAAPLTTGRLEKTNRTGRSGFDGAHYLLAHDRHAGETRGHILAGHLAWSGNARSFIETGPSGERQLQVGEWLAPGEIMLAPGQRHETPEALLAISNAGFNGIRRRFHHELRARRDAARIGVGPRRVHFNSWEAVYFEFDEARLQRLARDAAALGAERFVLDDGWFRGRSDNGRALGDWTFDTGRFPRGLGPLIETIGALGMDFGLWVEPEMISPDSDLYRAHPDWCLHAPDRPRPTQRRQLVLDLTRAEVRDHLFGSLDALLCEHDIAYLKWDHNRDLFPAASGGRPAAHAQTIGYLELLDRVRAAHPAVEIEACASGGARIDFAVAARAARVWASDNTDAIERVRIHRAMSLFYPPEIIGAHVGAAPNPTTSRRLGIDFRARTAMFAHLGLEVDPAHLAPAERERLARHIAHYKKWRDLIHSGVQHYADPDDPGITAQIIVSVDGGEAIALVARSDQPEPAVSAPVRLPGLDPAACYRLSLVEPWPRPAARHLADEGFWRSSPSIDGATLMLSGLRLPVVHPETAWLVHLERAAR